MRLKQLIWVLLVALFAAPAFAQEQRGALTGVITDVQGGVLPGVTVEAQNVNVGSVVDTVTDATGTYRFPSLAPGTYTVAATLSGFSAKKSPEVPVNLGQVKKVDLALSPAGVSESVSVSATAPLVDVKQSARATSIREEQIELLPKGRDFTSLVSQAAGANSEAKLGGLSIDGASAGENRFIVDGIETTNLQSGTSGKNVIVDFIEEVEVKSSGYTAEYGGATGGVINAVTKSGTNKFRGTALFNFEGSALTAANNKTLRVNLTNSDAAEYVTYPKDDRKRMEPGFGLGGPIVQNRAWFFAAYQPALTNTQRVVTPTTAVNPSAGTFDVTAKSQVQYLTANVTSQLNRKTRARLAYNNSYAKSTGLLPSLAGTDPAATNYGKTSAFPNYTVSGNLDYTASNNLLFGLRGGYYMSDQHDTNVTEQPLFRWTSTNNIGFLDVPASLQRATGFTSIPSNSKVTRDQQTRLYGQADMTYYLHLAGEHQWKAGVQFDRLGNDVLSGEARNRVSIFWGATIADLTGTKVKGTYGYYSVRSNGVAPQQGFITEGNVHSNNIGLFLQDAWSIGKKLTVNLGVRTEKEEVPTFTNDPNVPKYGLQFGFKDKLAPRAGFAYDVNGDGKWKVSGSWGMFYDIFKLELPRGSFGGDKWIEYYYKLDTYDWPNLVGGANCPPACNGTLIKSTNFRTVSLGEDSIDPDLKPMRTQEATFSVDHQLNDVTAVSVRYVHKQIDRAIEDTGSLDAQGNEIYVIANPGEGLTALASTNPRVALPKAKRDYDGVELSLEKRLKSNWYFRGSYLWSRLYGNYSGLSQSDENGRTSPNVGRAFDYPLEMFQDGGKPVFGRLPTDRPHQVKGQFIYQLPFGSSVGVNEYVASGTPITREIGIYPSSNLPVQYLGRGSDGRTPLYSQTDAFVQHTFKVQGGRSVQLSLNVFNVLNQRTATSKYSTYQKVNGVVPNDEAAFYTGKETLAADIISQGVIKSPLFLMDNGFQAPMAARVGLKFSF